MTIYATDTCTELHTCSWYSNVGSLLAQCQQAFYLTNNQSMKRVLVKLKPKVASLGFSRLELEGVAARIDGNLKEDATEEDIDAAIDAVLPYLELAQSSANRIINKAKEDSGNKPTATDESKTTEKPATKDGNEGKESAGANPLNGNDDLQKTIENAMKAAIAPFAQRLEAIEGEKVTTSRLSKIQEIAKKAGGTYEKTLLKNFGRMTFASEDDFTSYLDEVEADVDAYVQENSNNGLSNSPKPKGGAAGGKETIDPMLKERINDRQAETATPAIAGLPNKQ